MNHKPMPIYPVPDDNLYRVSYKYVEADMDLKQCPFCGGTAYKKGSDVFCENPRCGIYEKAMASLTWNCRAPNKEHKELAIELHDLKHAIREAYCQIECNKYDLISQVANQYEVLHNAGVQRDMDIIIKCCGDFL